MDVLSNNDCERIKNDVLKNPKHLLVFIQYEVMQRRSVYDAYINFCSTFGDDAMSYNDFDFWYYRFRNGEFDLDYDRSKDPKLRELSDLPIELVEMIIENVEKKERYVLANVSKAFRGIIDKQDVDTLNISLTRNEFKLSCDYRELCFKSFYRPALSVGSLNAQFWPFEEEESGEMVNVPPGTEYLENGFNALARIFNHPERRFGKINFSFDDIFLDHFPDEFENHSDAIASREKAYNEMLDIQISLQNFFKSLPHQINAEKFHVDRVICEDEILSVLSFLKPGVLQEIVIKASDASKFNVSRVIDLDQFKQAKSFTLDDIKFEQSIDNLSHFNKIKVAVYNITKNDLTRLMHKFLASTDFQSCWLAYNTRPVGLEVFRGKQVAFPDSRGFLKFQHVGDSYIFMERTYTSWSSYARSLRVNCSYLSFPFL